ncbi:MAG: hypothetical protein AVDCRST_MAG56-2884 [uncultured Cytophagales bacterium]|uniref:SH3b domain-containing protein n=1 Tax=uncultured Cytophagales bacterium TaxID=158755 RepID=A0A6J4IXU1_9SPHI|nr:MAG: hypothetical protein AVDCRST_MAG56-2884 [uncultured Cytophagales bacterium]
MKKQVTLFICTVLLAAAPAVVSAQSGYKISSSSGANLRKGPGTSHSATATIPAGANVRVLEKNSNGWYKVEYNGQTGYVAGDLVENQNAQQSSANRTADNTRQQPAGDAQDRNNAARQTGNGSQRDDRDDRSQNQGSKSNRTAGKSASKGGNAGSSSYKWGIGLRLGEPSGLTVKRYLSSGNALEVNLGRSSRWGYEYDADDFYRHSRFSDRDNYHFHAYEGGASTALQVRYLWQKPIRSAQGLDWYVGLGGQARFTTATYYYYYNEGNWDNDWWRWNLVEERRTDVDLGLDGIIGLEYTLPNTPISLFGDVNIFMEIVDRPFAMFGQGGIGARYNF